MAYNSYFPQGYYQPVYNPPVNAQQMPVNAPAQQSNGINWVQGEAAAKAFPVGAGQSVLLMDSEDSVMYIKSMDASGMPHPLRIFEYKERLTQKNEAGIAKGAEGDYVMRTEFEKFREDITRSIKDMQNNITEGEG